MILLSEGSGVYPVDAKEQFEAGSKKLTLNDGKVYIKEDARRDMFELVSDLAKLHAVQLNAIRGIYQNEIPLSDEDIEVYLVKLHDIGEKWQRDIEQLKKAFIEVVDSSTESAEDK